MQLTITSLFKVVHLSVSHSINQSINPVNMIHRSIN